MTDGNGILVHPNLGVYRTHKVGGGGDAAGTTRGDLELKGQKNSLTLLRQEIEPTVFRFES